MIDTLYTVDAKLNYIGEQLLQVSENTNSFGGITNSVLTVLGVIGSIITIIIFLQIKEYKLSRSTQKMIMLDLMRHFMVNSAILETVIDKLNTHKPIEGTLSRFASLENDLELGKFMLNARHYETLHDLCLKIRNYNSVALWVDKHMHENLYPRDILLKELNSLNIRGVSIVQSLKDLSSEIHRYRFLGIFPVNTVLTNEDLVKYVTRRYKTEPGDVTKFLHCSEFNKSGLGITYAHIIESQSERIIFMPIEEDPSKK